MMHSCETSRNKEAPRLSVVVCTYNRSALLADCLKSLSAQTLDIDLFEVIVVDNNSIDNTAEIVCSWRCANPNVRYVHETRQGVAHARNRGWREAIGEFVAYIDDDTVAVPEWCERILAAFITAEPQPAAVGGVIVPRLDSRPPWWFSSRLEVRTWGEAAGFLSSPTAHFGFSGANMAFQRVILCEQNGFNPAFGMSGSKVWLGEEPELFMRIHRTRPYFWFDPAIRVEHFVPPAQLRLGCRLCRAFQAGRSRRLIDRGSVNARGVLMEMAGVLHLFRSRVTEQPFSLMYAILSVMERISDRIGYFLTKSAEEL